MDTSRIIELAKNQGKSITFICSIIGKPKYYLNNLKNKNLSMPAEFLEKIAKELNTTPSYLLGENTTSETRDLFSDASTTFWERFLVECNRNGVNPNSAAKEMGISSGTITKWKNDSNPTTELLNKMATYFGVSVEYLLGNTSERNFCPKETIVQDKQTEITGEELELLSIYRGLNLEYRTKLLATAYNYRDIAKNTIAKGRDGKAV